ncbi:MAG: GNAT family N-acetyltransferase [Mycobacteriaceae bacterium]|nr:GNAT family N-acetyltransferase [Mycobacteriaceae bacterium]
MTIASVLSAPVGARSAAAVGPQYSLVVSADAEHRIAAQRLRYAVFAAEPGFTVPDDGSGLDADRFDEHCDHLLVRDDRTGEFVGCYRMLAPDVAARVGYYTATEFDIAALDAAAMGTVEMGRACVLTEHRNGSVLGLMWAGILHYLDLTGYDWVMGCVSVPMQAAPGDPEGVNVRGVRDLLLAKHATPPQRRARPHRPVTVAGRPLDELDAAPRPALPPLLRGYLRLGAQICGEPAHDPAFAVADFVALLGRKHANKRYLDRLQAAAAASFQPEQRSA